MIFRKFIHPSTAQVLRVASIFLTVANTILALGSTLTGMPASFAWLSTLWPTLYGVAFGLHQIASTFGIAPDSALAGQLSAVASGLIPPAPINAAEYRAGMNIAMRGDQLPDDASSSAKAGFACVPDSERGKYDADGNLKPTTT